jgi:hypothetical protein
MRTEGVAGLADRRPFTNDLPSLAAGLRHGQYRTHYF